MRKLKNSLKEIRFKHNSDKVLILLRDLIPLRSDTNVKKIMKKLYWSLPVCLTLIFFGCNNPPGVQEITDKLIQNAGGDLYLKSDIEFDFRKNSL